MIRASLEEAQALLTDWKERGIKIGACLVPREDLKEEHRFWANVVEVTEAYVRFSG